MSLNTVLQVNDAGINIIVTVMQQDDTTVEDLSAATSKVIYLGRPDGSLISGNASFVTDGTDGKISYLTQTSDLNLIGIYKVQASYVVSGNIKHTDKDQFVVSSNVFGVT